MTNLARRIYSPLAFDTIFGICAVASAIMLWFGAGHAVPAIAPPAEPWHKGAALIGIVLTGGALASATTRLDQKLADDFVFQVLAKSAFIGLCVFIFAVVLWTLLFENSLGALSGFTVFCLAMGGWSFGYFYTRLRGTGA